jgi:hypothetical protein
VLNFFHDLFKEIMRLVSRFDVIMPHPVVVLLYLAAADPEGQKILE